MRNLSTLGIGLLLAASTVTVVGQVASADTTPPPETPATVSVDALPTVQINGVVWAQVTVGNTVYATGKFTKARPAGSSAGKNETSRSNLLAYDLTTGNLISSFDHSLNAQGLAIAASPDGTRVYVGGDFTSVDGKTRNRLAAFDVATGTLVNDFTAGPKNKVRAVTATNDAVYVGGSFNASSNGARRSSLAGYTRSGSLLPWAPASDGIVSAMVMSPDQSLVVIGGSFGHLNGMTYHALGAISVATGLPVPWASQSDSFPVRLDSDSSGITSLSTDGISIFWTAYNFTQIGQPAKPEGRGAISPIDGQLIWLNDCHGDSYSAFPIGQVLYSSGHAHDCEAAGAYPETSPRTFHHGLAETTYPTHANGRGTHGYASFQGIPASTQLDWYPTFTAGSFTGKYQAGWSVTGNSNYVSYGGEFTKVNSVNQQGLVRFAISSLAPNKQGPKAYTSSAVSASSANFLGLADVSFKTTWDPDNAVLTYKVFRDGGSNSVYETTADTRFWNLPTLNFTDSGLTAFSSHTYKVVVTDPFANNTTGKQ